MDDINPHIYITLSTLTVRRRLLLSGLGVFLALLLLALAVFMWEPYPTLALLLVLAIITKAMFVLGLVVGGKMQPPQTMRPPLTRDEGAFTQGGPLDTVTGLPNRDAVYQYGERMLHEQRPLALLLIDLDHFHLVNNACGYDAGDDLLAQFAGRLRQANTPQAMLARLGSDQFVVLLTQPSSATMQVAHLVLEHLTHPFLLAGERIYMRASIGIASSTPELNRMSTLLTQADIALSYARTSGCSVAVYDPAFRMPAQIRLQLEQQLRQALLRNEFILHYQPILDLTTSRIVSVEALVRWNHPQHGLVPPGSFLPLAGEVGLLGGLDRRVLQQAVSQAARWHRAGHRIDVAINMTAHSLSDLDIVATITDLLVSYQLSPAHMIIEVTEDTALHNAQSTACVRDSLKEMGIRIALDDFGTGYASLTHLRQVPVDIVKIDRSFTNGIGHDPRDEAVLRALLSLGSQLDLAVVVEGIETTTQLLWLQGIGCPLGQGYFFGRPMPPDTITRMLAGCHTAPNTHYVFPKGSALSPSYKRTPHI